MLRVNSFPPIGGNLNFPPIGGRFLVGDFAAHYQSVFRPSQETGGRRSELSAGASPEDYCRQFGFNDRTVRRWMPVMAASPYDNRGLSDVRTDPWG